MDIDLSSCRTRLADRVLHRVGSHGLISAPTTSRVLETSLLLFLLTTEEVAPAEATLARCYLRDVLSGDPPEPLQQVFARAALGEPIEPGAAEHALSSFRHFSGPRKLTMFTVLLDEVTGRKQRVVASAEAGDEGREQIWVQFQRRALQIVADPSSATAADFAFLTPALAPGPPWQANHLAQLVGLLALRKSPEHRPAVRRALARLAARQLSGGGVPFVTGLDIFATALAGISLLRTHPHDPRTTALADALAETQQHDGGFGFTLGVTQTDVDDTSYALEFLRGFGTRYASAVTGAEDYLLNLRNDDGGFPTFIHGAPSEAAMTAGAARALAPSPAHRSVVEDAISFLIDAGTSSERSWSRNTTNVVFRSTAAFTSLTPEAPSGLRERAHEAMKRGMCHLTATQQSDGGWGHTPEDPSDPISTAYAVIALSRTAAHASDLARALRYLHRSRRPDGGYLSRPDQAGPRPLLYDAPALADVCVLMAFTAVL
ncbi:prenyltransferase/squalene oxidase repeat-containing protein [Streptomyces sp. NPDC087908]|uniref:prenyltransferase/squalene oxidase repeat-containing protein n=1 Tax=Streptomyces sp. NPDC087908 TaxID=3365820 RepID=UPI003818EDF2